jgi:hypothetical protein
MFGYSLTIYYEPGEQCVVTMRDCLRPTIDLYRSTSSCWSCGLDQSVEIPVYIMCCIARSVRRLRHAARRGVLTL